MAGSVSTIAGLRSMWRVLETCGLFAQSHVDGDPYRTAFNEGGRRIGLILLAKLFQADPDAYSRMQKDAAKQELDILEPKPRTDEPNEDETDGN
jgi:hypothetical protein